ncbi:MAG: hypothetical protein DMG13_09035 [Acidobacteria bacterium]|nr:MAG: hypothetical protein DMG13_09035 [Acidobacteriota bacterium]
MKYGLLAFAVPAGILGFGHASEAQVFLTEDQALRGLFGNCRIERREKILTDEDRQALLKATGLHFPESSFTFLVAEHNGALAGYSLVMNEIGKSEPITFMVVMNPEHRVVDVLVMVFRESRGAEIREKRFLRQFQGKQSGDPIAINNDIVNYSGATLSSKAITRGVKRALGLLNHFYPVSRSTQTISPAFILPALPLPHQIGAFRQVRYMMGTLCEIRLYAGSSAHASAAASAAFSEIRRLEKVFSAYDPGSELSRVNRDAVTRAVPVSADMWRLSRAAVRYARATDGAVDVTVGPLLKAFRCGNTSVEDAFRRVGIGKIALDGQNRTVRFMTEGLEMDFGGLAKGYAARRAAEVLDQWGVSSALVNLGGSSIFTQGARDWLVGIADPASPNRYAAILSVGSGRAVTCSGTYERSIETPAGLASEIIDPRTGQPLVGLRAAVAITASPVWGEVVSKALLLDGGARSWAQEYLLVAGKPEGPAIDAHLARTALFT